MVCASSSVSQLNTPNAGINGGGPWPEQCNVPITIKDRVWYFHARAKHATKNNPIVLKECPGNPLRVTLLRTGEPIPYTLDQQTFLLSIPEAMKVTNATDVVKVEFGADVDPEPYLFRHW